MNHPTRWRYILTQKKKWSLIVSRKFTIKDHSWCSLISNIFPNPLFLLSTPSTQSLRYHKRLFSMENPHLIFELIRQGAMVLSFHQKQFESDSISILFKWLELLLFSLAPVRIFHGELTFEKRMIYFFIGLYHPFLWFNCITFFCEKQLAECLNF